MFGLEMGNYIHPKEYGNVKTPVPMDVPRIRYEFGTRRVGTSPPVANAGPNQIGVPAGTITLNGSGSYDPLGEALTYQLVADLRPHGDASPTPTRRWPPSPPRPARPTSSC